MFIWFLTVNFVLAALYAIIKGIHREDMGMAFFFLFLPGLGWIICFLPKLFRVFLEKVEFDRETVLTHTFEIDRQPEHPDIREALNVAPVEDAMAVSSRIPVHFRLHFFEQGVRH